MNRVRFFSEGLKFSIPGPKKKAAWLSLVIGHEGKSLSCLNVIFCTDAHLSRLNKKYLNHSTLTDILTFQYSAPLEPIEGDLFISIPRVKENARKFNVPFEQELSRVMVHGVLHLLGYSDKSAAEKTKMRLKEDAYLSLQ
jgi:rRNA maturation RNase YbeY